MSYKEEAKKKLDNEYKSGKYDRYGTAVKSSVLDTLKKFIEQDEEFAQAIVQSSGTFSQCVEAAMKGCGSAISDIEVYRRCVQYYFKGATVDFKMEINLIGEATEPSEPAKSQTLTEMPKAETKKISLSLLDFI